jgi:glutathione S-transferase
MACTYWMLKEKFWMVKQDKPFSESELNFHKFQFKKCMKMMENWLTENKYLCGNEISIADLSLACELATMQLMEKDFSQNTHVKAWFD